MTMYFLFLMGMTIFGCIQAADGEAGSKRPRGENVIYSGAFGSMPAGGVTTDGGMWEQRFANPEGKPVKAWKAADGSIRVALNLAAAAKHGVRGDVGALAKDEIERKYSEERDQRIKTLAKECIVWK